MRARGDGDRRPRPRGDLAHGLAGRASSRTPSTARRRSSRCARSASTTRSTRDASCSSPGSRASRASRSTSRRSAAAAPTRPPSRSPRRSAPTTCEIYTDVEGVFTADPRIVPNARKLHALSYDEMLEMAASGAQRSPATLGRVRAKPRREASRPLDVRRCGRHVDHGGGRSDAREGDHLRRRAHARGARLPRRRASAPRTLFDALADASVNVDTIVQVSAGEIVFSAPSEDRVDVERTLARSAPSGRCATTSGRSASSAPE